MIFNQEANFSPNINGPFSSISKQGHFDGLKMNTVAKSKCKSPRKKSLKKKRIMEWAVDKISIGLNKQD